MVLVSIIMPTFNQGHLISKAIESIIAQTFSNWELIIINNFSLDDTLERVEGFDDPRIRIYNYSNNGIIAASRNLGIEKALGQYLAFLDSDDYWMCNKLSECINFLEQNNLDLVCHGEKWKYLDSELKKDVFYGPDKAATPFSLIFNKNALSTSAVMVKKKEIDSVVRFNVDSRLIMVEDYDLWIRLAMNNCKIGFLCKILGVYVIHRSTSHTTLHRQMIAEIYLLSYYFKKYKSESGVFYYFYCVKRLGRLFASYGLRYVKVQLKKLGDQ
jgi:glycosyltransferase involved in cell wall biosynthesis